MKTCNFLLAILAGLVVSSSVSLGANRARVLGDPQLERPTLHSLGVYWIVGGDDNRNASVHLEYRKAGTSSWRAGAPWCAWSEGAPDGAIRQQAQGAR